MKKRRQSPKPTRSCANQLIALYNLNHAAQKQLTVNRNLDESASLLIDIVLKDPFLHYAPENKFAFTSRFGRPLHRTFEKQRLPGALSSKTAQRAPPRWPQRR